MEGKEMERALCWDIGLLKIEKDDMAVIKLGSEN